MAPAEQLSFAQTYADIFGYIGFLGALVGWFLQWKKSREERQNEIRSLWDNISVIKAVMGEIERAELKLRLEHKELPLEIYQAHGELAILFRTALARAITREGKVSLETIQAWRKSGKLSSDWQQKCAMTILLSKELSNKELDGLDKKYSVWDSIDDESPLGSARISSHEEGKKSKIA